MLHLDTSTAFGARVLQRLRDEQIVWLTTTGADGTPQPSPVWFLWQEGTLLIYSRPNTPKVRNIARNPRVALNFDGDGRGGDIVVFTGEARLAGDAPPADEVGAYTAKYAEGLRRIGMAPDAFAREYSTALRVTPTKVRGF